MNQVINFYKFVELDSLLDFKAFFLETTSRLGLLGKIILAQEGINGALCGPPEALEEFLKVVVHQKEEFCDLEARWSQGSTKPFKRLSVIIKPAIVTFLHGGQDPSVDDIHAGSRLSPEEWEALLTTKEKDFALVDARNDYEYQWGTFQGAELLNIQKFSDFAAAFLEKFEDQKDKKILMFCTGGIRCEKAAAWAKSQGFSSVFQLDGGILGYLEKRGKSHYDGSCFVFDHRWALNSQLTETDRALLPELIQPKPGTNIPSASRN